MSWLQFADPKMKKTITIVLFLVCYNISIGQTSSETKDSCDTLSYFMKSYEELLKYIDNPCPNDSSCKDGILKAKTEIERGQIKFLMPISLGTFEVRQEQQLRRVCNSNGLIFSYELFSCVDVSGQTSGCYGLYMDKIIAQKFGKDFKEDLLKRADSIYVASHPTVYYTNCDTLPRLYDKDIHESTKMDVAINKELFDKLKVSKYGNYPQVDIGFYIDTAGIPSDYFLSQFILYDDIKQNNKFKTELTKIAFNYIKKFKLWKPGIILSQNVRTEYNVRISFIKLNKE